MHNKLYPSLMDSDLLNLASTITNLEPLVDGFHIDICDGIFAPNITFGPAHIGQLQNATEKPLHIHLMVTSIAWWLGRIQFRPQDVCFVHHEVCSKSALQILSTHGGKLGLALLPATPVPKTINALFTEILLVGVQPGFSGQKFTPSVLEKTAAIKKQNSELTITFDGGVNATTIPAMLQHHGDNFVVGSALFRTPDPKIALAGLRALLK